MQSLSTLFGISGGYTQDRFLNCLAMRALPSGQEISTLVDCREPDVVSREEERFGGVSLFLLAGGGADIALSDRVSLVPQVRVDPSAGTVDHPANNWCEGGVLTF